MNKDICHICKVGKLILKKGFLACDNYPKCTYTYKIDNRYSENKGYLK